MQKSKKPEDFVQKPVYEGGMEAMRQFIRQNLTYPEAALKERIEGTVRVEYTIDYQGVVTETKVISGLGYGCDEEAMRVVGLLKFTVAKNRKRRVAFHRTINIHFRLPKKVEKPKLPTTTTSIQYVYTPKKKPAEQQKPKPKSSEVYTITINY